MTIVPPRGRVCPGAPRRTTQTDYRPQAHAPATDAAATDAAATDTADPAGWERQCASCHIMTSGPRVGQRMPGRVETASHGACEVCAEAQWDCYRAARPDRTLPAWRDLPPLPDWTRSA